MKQNLTKRETLQRKCLLRILLYLGVMTVALLGFTIGSGLSFTNDLIALGCIFIGLAFAVLIGGIVLCIVTAKKHTALISAAFLEEVTTQLETREGKTELADIDGEKIAFTQDGLLKDGRLTAYGDVTFAYTVFNRPRAAHDELRFCLGIEFSADRKVQIPLDGDVMDAIKAYGLTVVNQEDLDYYFANAEKLTGKMLRALSFLTVPAAIPLVFAKTEEQKKSEGRATAKSWVYVVSYLVLIFGLTALFAWFGSREGSKVSETLAFNLVFKIVFTVAILCLAFVKAKNLHLLDRLLFITYAATYWVCMLFATSREFTIVNLVAFFLSVFFAFFDFKNGKFIFTPKSRFLVFAALMLLLIMPTDITMVEEAPWLITCAIIAGVVTLIAVAISIVYLNKKMQKEQASDEPMPTNVYGVRKKKLTKGAIVGWTVLTATCSLLLGFAGAFAVSGAINYAFDTSTPDYYTAQIVRLEQGGRNDSPDAVVVVGEKEVKLPISDNEYWNLEVGDTISFSKYSGALGWAYYIVE